MSLRRTVPEPSTPRGPVMLVLPPSGLCKPSVTTKSCFSVNSKNKTQKYGRTEEVVKNIILVKNEYEIHIRHAKNTPMFHVLCWKHPQWSPTPTHSALLYLRGPVVCFGDFTWNDNNTVASG